MSDLTRDMIQQALDQDFNAASKTFGDIMSVKLSDVLDQEKVRLADQIFNGAEEDDDDQMELDLDMDEEEEDVSESDPDAEESMGDEGTDGSDNEEEENDEGSEES